MRENNVPVEYVRKFSEYGLNASTIVYHFKMGLKKLSDFKFNKQPKALILFPTNDPKQISGTVFNDDGTFVFLKELQKVYDMRIRAISTVEEMYNQLNDCPEINLLILSGHGSKTSLTFGKNISKYGINYAKDESDFTVKRNDLKEHLRILAPDAVIFLDSCLNGSGKENEINMANFVAENAPGRKVISCTESFNFQKIGIKSVYPFNVIICRTSILMDSLKYNIFDDSNYSEYLNKYDCTYIV